MVNFERKVGKEKKKKHYISTALDWRKKRKDNALPGIWLFIFQRKQLLFQIIGFQGDGPLCLKPLVDKSCDPEKFQFSGIGD